MQKILKSQYKLVMDSRKRFLKYCESISYEHLNQQIENFGRGSISNLLIHISSAYEYWLGEVSLAKDISYFGYDIPREVKEIYELFERVDNIAAEFLETFKDNYDILFEGNTGQRNVKASAFQLFLHVITHEFHHTGQILSMSRHLGYTPPNSGVVV
ncbi:MAG: DinB family protein [Ignavibacteriaceae bacterium]